MASDVRAVLDYLNDDLRVDQMMISPGYAYQQVADQEHVLGAVQTRQMFREAFADRARRRWRLNHSPQFLDFLEGKVAFPCTAWAIRSYSPFGWQRPCSLLSDGYAATDRELVESIDSGAWAGGVFRGRVACGSAVPPSGLRSDSIIPRDSSSNSATSSRSRRWAANHDW